MSISPALRIGVLRGGPSGDYEASLKTGAEVLRHLSETHRPLDIFIDRNGMWHLSGAPRSPERILPHLDVVFNALHGSYGEDGAVQEILERHKVPYTGSNRFSSAFSMHKAFTKEKINEAGIKTPVYTVISPQDNVLNKVVDIHNAISLPLIVKPLRGSASLDVSVCQTLEDVHNAVEAIIEKESSALVEEYIPGREVTCGVVDSFRSVPIYALPPVEITRLPNGAYAELCPSGFGDEEKRKIEYLATLAHKTLGLHGYSRSDFIVHPRRGIYFLEVNTLPKLTKKSLLTKSLDAVGISMKEFIHHVLSLALERK